MGLAFSLLLTSGGLAHSPPVDWQLAEPEPAQLSQRLEPTPPSRTPLPAEGPTVDQPPADDLLTPPPLESPAPAPPLPSGTDGSSDRLCIVGFEVVGSTVFSATALAQIATEATFPGSPPCQSPQDGRAGALLSFTQIQQARDAITQYYIDHNYVTSGAFIPEQMRQTDVVQLQVVEGQIETIQVLGLEHLNPAYVRDRIALATHPPLNTDSLLQGLQLLQLDPLIKTIHAELSPSLHPGQNQLVVQIEEANPYRLGLAVDNGRTPLVGTVQRWVRGGDINLLGQGDQLLLDYANTDGSNSADFSYIYPINARNGTISLSYGFTSSWVIEDEFDSLDIQSKSRYYELTYRQPVLLTPNQELALGLTLTREESESIFNPGGFGTEPFPVLGSDTQGNTRVTPLRFTQDYLNRDSQQVLALRSQFSLGTGLFGVTTATDSPDAYFLSWRGQSQWIRLLGPNSLIQLRADAQLASQSLVPFEQMGIGGLGSVRGYRQDQLLTDNGLFTSAEVHLPLAQIPESKALMQIIPFIDFGIGWNHTGPAPNPNTLLSTGLGITLEIEGGFSARLDYGIPLLANPNTGNSWQENGLLFSIQYEPWP